MVNTDSDEQIVQSRHPQDDEKQLTATIKIRIFQEKDKYKPEDMAKVIQADLSINLHHSILCLSMELIEDIILNLNHMYQLLKDQYDLFSEINQQEMQ